MRIAVLGWGSLIRSPGCLSTRGDWELTGPVLPIEFTRKSSDGRLTLVIDHSTGVPVQTYWIESSMAALDDAIENLRKRERTTLERIGYLELARPSSRARDPR